MKTIKTSIWTLSLALFLACHSQAQPFQLRAEMIGKEFPSNTGVDRLIFDGCADCFGPWTVTASETLRPRP